MIPRDTFPRTPHELRSHYHNLFDAQVLSGKVQPFVYPWGTFGAFVVIVYLLTPQDAWMRKLRFVYLGWITAFAGYCILYTRARDPTPAFGLGLISAWSVIWVGTIAVWHDMQRDFQRIERLGGAFGGRASRAVYQKGEKEHGHQNGTTKEQEKHDIQKDLQNSNLGPRDRHGPFAWQPYPRSPFIERLDWVLDIFCNFRGAGWNWRISSVPPPPKSVQLQLQQNSVSLPKHSNRVHPGQLKVYSTRKEVLIANLKKVVGGYIILDALKTLTNHDPYFWGLTASPPPSYFPSILHTSPILLCTYRTLVSMALIQVSLQSLFALAPLFFVGLLGQSLIGARAEPWMYPETWGSFSVVLERGLGGWWSGWWHQTFRFAFETPSRKITEWMGLDPKRPVAKALQLFIAFGLSGILHACGSYTQPGPTHPILGPLRFFLLQAVGVFVETLLTQFARKAGLHRRIPTSVKHAFTLAYICLWGYFTAPLLIDDFAQGGLWLYEPLPISLFRGLGYGVDGDGWWCWRDGVAWWYTSDEKWWRSGILL